MSSTQTGKLQDHYAVLGVDPRADSETIQRAYAKLAQRYHPKNSPTGDQQKFEAVNYAYETLSDPLLRHAFDKLKGIGEEQGNPTFSGLEFFKGLESEAGLRATLLCVLYDRRRNQPFTPSLSVRHIEIMLRATSEELIFVVWYLKQRGFIVSDDKSSLLITVEGMDFLEKNKPTPEVVMSFIKPAGGSPVPAAPGPGPAAQASAASLAAAEEREAGIKAFGRSLALRASRRHQSPEAVEP